MQRTDGVTVLDVRSTLQTEDYHLICVTYRGIYMVAPEVRQRVRQGATVGE